MGGFPLLYGNTYILGIVDYVSKWVDTTMLLTNDSKVEVNFLKKQIFTSLWAPRTIISYGGSYFINNLFRNLLGKYGIRHKVAITFHL